VRRYIAPFYHRLDVSTASHPMTDAEFASLCEEHPDLFFEMTAEGEHVVMPATQFPAYGTRRSGIN
jgi:Uma2 family endonuclease